jgi:hypothetical protein
MKQLFLIIDVLHYLVSASVDNSSENQDNGKWLEIGGGH